MKHSMRYQCALAVACLNATGQYAGAQSVGFNPPIILNLDIPGENQIGPIDLTIQSFRSLIGFENESDIAVLNATDQSVTVFLHSSGFTYSPNETKAYSLGQSTTLLGYV